MSEAEALYRRYRQPVRAYLVRLTGRPEWADDLLQETFFRALRSIGSFRGEATPLTWLCSIARNVAASGLDRAGAGPPVSRAAAGDRAGPIHTA